uniref:Uncharacterized protein n=1 Tax=Peronospora matthiolae TaxID=2874970 RepID=A0AAV1VIS0_9STRA
MPKAPTPRSFIEVMFRSSESEAEPPPRKVLTTQRLAAL